MATMIKIPLYWMELFEGLSDAEVGKIMGYVFEYAEKGDVYLTKPLCTKVMDVLSKCIDDIRYQKTHRNAYKKPENVREIRNSEEYREWRASVFERDHYTCQNCKKVGGCLNAHHIKPFSKYPELRFDMDNGITLCKQCHKLAHEKRG